MEAQFRFVNKFRERPRMAHAFELRSGLNQYTEKHKGKADTYIRKVTGTLRSQERPKLKSSLLSLSMI